MKRVKKLLIVIIAIAIACTSGVPAFAVSDDSLKADATADVTATIDIEAEAAIVMDAETGRILYEKDAYTKREPASVTKIITCLVALENLELDQKITITADGNPTGNTIGVKAGEVFTAEELLYALMLPSANDAAVALAIEVGGTEENFCKMMNEKAAECGAENSNFMNPNGLNWPGDEAHLTTAYDLAVITREALKNEEFRKIVSTVEYEIPATNKSDARTLINTNKFLWDDDVKVIAESQASEEGDSGELWVPEYYEGVIGVKTGLTSSAGSCFVGAVNSHGTELISVVLHSDGDSRFKDTVALWDYALENFYDTHVLAAAGEAAEKVRVKRGEVRSVEAVPEEDAVITVPAGESIKDVKTKIEVEKLRAPVEKGQVVGSIKIFDGDELVCERNLLAAESVEEGGPLSIFGIPDWMAPFIYIFVVLIILILLILRRIKKQAEKRRRKRNRREKVRKYV